VTFSIYYYKGLTNLGNLSKATNEERIVIYGGETSLKTTNGIACPWRGIDKL